MPTSAISLNITWFSKINIAICCLGILLNVGEIILILRKRKNLMIFEMYILSLACGDMLVLTAISIFDGMLLKEPNSKFTYLMYLFTRAHQPAMMPLEIRILVAVKRFSACSSSFTLLIIGIDRLLAVRYPFKHRVWITKSKARLLIVISWVSALILCSIEAILTALVFTSVSYYLKITDASLIIAAATTFFVVYSLIVFTVVRRRKDAHHAKSKCVSQKLANTETEVIITCCLVVLAYDICLLPYAVECLFNIPTDNYRYIFMALYMNSVIDPIIYFFKGFLSRRNRNKRRHCEHTINIVFRRDVDTKSAAINMHA